MIPEPAGSIAVPRHVTSAFRLAPDDGRPNFRYNLDCGHTRDLPGIVTTPLAVPMLCDDCGLMAARALTSGETGDLELRRLAALGELRAVGTLIDELAAANAGRGDDMVRLYHAIRQLINYRAATK